MTERTRDREQPDPAMALWVHRMTLLIYLTAAISGSMLAAGFAGESRWGYVVACVCIAGLAVLAEEVPKVRSLNAAAFAGFVIMAMLLLWRGASAVLALVATTSALAAWDLHAFRLRLMNVDKLPAPRALIDQHLRRLSLSLGLGLGLGLLGLWVRVDTSIAIVAGLIALAAIGLTGAVGFLQRTSD